jgi:hypothetical protein
MRVVHIQVLRDQFANTLGKMREWLDGHSRPLVQETL